MNFLSRWLQKFFNSSTKPKRNTAAVANAVLEFLSVGLSSGAQTIAENYKPSTKVDEFVTVSKQLLQSLKAGYEQNFASDFVEISMKVNEQATCIEITQAGADVMLSMGESATFIRDFTLTELYANLRIDMIKHPEIYGKKLQSTAMSFPDPLGFSPLSH